MTYHFHPSRCGMEASRMLSVSLRISILIRGKHIGHNKVVRFCFMEIAGYQRNRGIKQGEKEGEKGERQGGRKERNERSINISK